MHAITVFIIPSLTWVISCLSSYGWPCNGADLSYTYLFPLDIYTLLGLLDPTVGLLLIIWGSSRELPRGRQAMLPLIPLDKSWEAQMNHIVILVPVLFCFVLFCFVLFCCSESPRLSALVRVLVCTPQCIMAPTSSPAFDIFLDTAWGVSLGWSGVFMFLWVGFGDRVSHSPDWPPAHNKAKNGLQLLILLPLPPKCWYHYTRSLNHFV